MDYFKGYVCISVVSHLLHIIEFLLILFSPSVKVYNHLTEMEPDPSNNISINLYTKQSAN